MRSSTNGSTCSSSSDIARRNSTRSKDESVATRAPRPARWDDTKLKYRKPMRKPADGDPGHDVNDESRGQAQTGARKHGSPQGRDPRTDRVGSPDPRGHRVDLRHRCAH